VKCSSSVRQTPVFCFPSSHAPPPQPPPPTAHIAHTLGSACLRGHSTWPRKRGVRTSDPFGACVIIPPTVSQNAGLRSQTDNL
jgi:hypothetical protein